MENKLISIVIPVGEVSTDLVSLYMQKRTEGSLAGKWEFPGGHIEPNEEPIEAAKREYKEECGVTCENLVHFKTFSFDYKDTRICFWVYLLKCSEPLTHFQEFKFDLQELSKKYSGSFPDANYGLIDELVEYLAVQVKYDSYEKIWT